MIGATEVAKFETAVSKNGTIQLPSSSELEDQEVEVIVTAKTRTDKGSAWKFAESWAGIISSSNGDVEEARIEYLKKKYLKKLYSIPMSLSILA